jgi:hypothetical protein
MLSCRVLGVGRLYGLSPTLWPGRIREAYDLVVRDPRYPEQAHHLWKVNIQLDAIAE